MRRLVCSSLVLAICAVVAVAQNSKPWTELTEKDVAKILNDSAWGQTQTEGNSQSAGTALTNVGGSKRDSERILSSNDANRMESGQPKVDKTIRFRTRFLSAKPVRAAFARYLLLKKGEGNEELSAQLQEFVDRSFGDYVVVVFTAEAADPRLVGPTMQFLNSANVDELKDKVYLERKDGKRSTLAEYRPPGPDGMGAKFVFMRTLDGEPFLTPESDNVRFFAQLSEKMKITLKYKVADMMYDGKLEY